MIAPLLLIAALQSSEATEPNTQVKFATELQTPTGGQLLAGTGVRTRTMLKVKVYAFGLYVEGAGARAALAGWQGKSVAELRKAFRDSVDDYLAFCAERGEEPDKPFSGQFVTRISPELHRRASLAASVAGKSLNAWVAEQLEGAVESRKLSNTSAGKPTLSNPARRRRS